MEVAPLLAALFFLSALFLHWGAVIVGVPGRAYYKGLLSLVTATILILIVSTALSIASPAGAAVAALLVWIMTKVCYHTDIWRALVACLVGGVLTAVVVYLAVTALGGKA
jgi:hypothetical protein